MELDLVALNLLASTRHAWRQFMSASSNFLDLSLLIENGPPCSVEPRILQADHVRSAVTNALNHFRPHRRIGQPRQDRISAEAGQLRDLLSYLRAPEVLMQQGPVTSLQAWIERTRQDTALSIQTDLAMEAEQALSVEAQVTLYRVFREAIRNAVKHSSGRCIRAQLQLDGAYVRFSIQDDGQGFDVERALQTDGKGYSSLQDMRIYVESAGRRLDIRSTRGRGDRRRRTSASAGQTAAG